MAALQTAADFPSADIPVAGAPDVFNGGGMNPAGQDIEVEVVAIDDRLPKKPKPQAPPAEPAQPLWMRVLGTIRRLPAWLWPLWVLLGVIALFLLLTVGVVAGAAWLLWRGLRGLWRA
ncbi:MAG TPA: hypothetical protein VFY13_05340 [Luteolibacter sp.]|nr:hypothetical protein [Luteolibacter sp.]